VTTPHLARRDRAQDIQGAIQAAKKVKNGQKYSTWAKIGIDPPRRAPGGSSARL